MIRILIVAALALTMSSFSPVEKVLLDSSTLQIRNVAPKKPSRKIWKEMFRNQIETANYRALGYLIKNALTDGVEFLKLQKYAGELECEPMQKALEAASHLYDLYSETDLDLPDCIQLALYIETDFHREIKEFGNYRNRKSTGLSKTVEYDPETNQIFIHLNLGDSLNRSGKKVGKAICYDPQSPEVVTHYVTHEPIASEIAAIKDLQGLDGLYEIKAVTSQQNEDGAVFLSLFTKHYRYGTLSKFLESKNGQSRLSFKDKMRIAHDILIGLESMHAKGYVHRDLCLSSFLISRKHRETTRGTRFSAVLADFSRAVPIRDAVGKNAQHVAFYRAPEALEYSLLKENDYFATDLYAVGCIFYSLFYGKAAPWVDVDMMNDTKKTIQDRAKGLRDTLEKYRQKRFRMLFMKNRFRDNVPMTETVERFILLMVDPVPVRRTNAKELRQIMGNLIKRTNPKPID